MTTKLKNQKVELEKYEIDSKEQKENYYKMEKEKDDLEKKT